MADRQVKVTLTAQVQGYVEGMQKAAQATRETGSETEKLAQQQQAFEQMGRAAMVAGGAMAVGLIGATKAAIDWDSAWAGVTKTVDGTPEQMAAIEQGLRDLTGVLPASHAEIAAVAEAAGQLGIETPNVLAFTKTMIDLGETTNLSSEQAATSLARFMNVMGTSQDQVSNLGSALVELGNNYATTEAEILEMSMRLAGAGKQIGMTEGEVMGLSTALSSVGIEAEAGGSAMSKVMIDIAASVEEGGDRLQQFSSIAGVSADEFAAKWRSDPGAALALFVQGLSNAEAQGQSTLGVLAELGITEVRMRDALLRSASASDIFTEAMLQGNSAVEKNTALTEEAEKRYETTAAKLQIMGNKVVDAAVTIGEKFLPALEGGAEAVGGFADAISGMEGPMAAVVAWGGLVVSGILLTGGAALVSIPKIAAYKVALETLGISGNFARRGVRGLASFLLGPWGAALAVAGVSMMAFNKAMDASVVSAQDMEVALKQGENALDTMTGKAVQNEQGITKLFVDVSQHLEDLPALADKAAESGRGFWSSMSFNENAALDAVQSFGDSLNTLASTDLPAAQEAFAKWVGKAGLSDTQALTFLNEEMGGFKSTLLDTAKAAGLATDDASLLKHAMGALEPAVEDNVDSLEELQGVAIDTSDAVSELADEIRNFGSAQFDVEKATIQFYDALDSLKENLDLGSASLDMATEAGRDTNSAMLDVAASTNEYAASLQATGATTDDIAGALDAGRQRIIETRMALGDSRQAAELYADSLIATPETIKTQVELKGVADAEAELSNLVRTRYMGVNVYYNDASVPEWKAPLKVPGTANGGLHEFANGGFATGIYSGGTPIHKFAEPETRWEAYISGKPGQEDRNRQIWVDAGERLGMGEILKAISGNNGQTTVQQDNKFFMEHRDPSPIIRKLARDTRAAL